MDHKTWADVAFMAIGACAIVGAIPAIILAIAWAARIADR